MPPRPQPHALFSVEGQCWRPQGFSHLDLSEIHEYYQVEDVSKVVDGFTGKAVRLRKVVDIAGPDYGTRWLTVESMDGEFSVCLPLAETVRTALLIYERGGKPIPFEEGGPVRFVVPFHPDGCVHVKSVGKLLITREPGRDTRPATRQQHEALHAKQG
jgi:DMSO/TMAO reductase YedYZ molybdopterin-dependent catalytic subunit